MINVYVLYNNIESSVSYLNDCKNSLESLDKEGKFNFIPVLGYREPDAISLYEASNIPVIPYYRELLQSNLEESLRKEINGAMCATMGHAKIWSLIAESKQPGIILEHDAIWKSTDFDLSELEDFMIFWLGPRVEKINDYNFPSNNKINYIETSRFEGVHAYAITSNTAEYLCKKWTDYGFVDSIDGFLAMRNYYNLTMIVLDPPPLVTAVNRDGLYTSTIESFPAIWNSCNYPGFIKGLCVPAPLERIVDYTNEKFINSFPWLTMTPPKIFAITNDDGTSIKVLGNAVLSHLSDSKIDYICPQDKLRLISYNSYFSNFYYKIKAVGRTQGEYRTITDIISKFDLHGYDFGYIDCYHLDKIDCLYNSLRLLEHIDWILVFFDEANDAFIDILEEMGYKCKRVLNLVCIKK